MTIVIIKVSEGDITVDWLLSLVIPVWLGRENRANYVWSIKNGKNVNKPLRT